MDETHHDRYPADVDWVAQMLEQERPTATPLELDRIKLRSRQQAARGGRSRTKGTFLKSRLAITAILVLGLMTSGTGATLALSGPSERGSAGKAQYPDSSVQGGQESGGPSGGEGGGGAGVLGTQEGGGGGGGEAGPTASQPNRQVTATESDDKLPFTGYAAIPIILMGLALLAAGIVLQRGARRAAEV